MPGSPHKPNLQRLLTRLCAGVLLFGFVAGQTLAQNHSHGDEESVTCVVCVQSDTAPTVGAPAPERRHMVLTAIDQTAPTAQPLTASHAAYLTRAPPRAS